ARRDEAVDGSADPPLQALHRGLPCPGGRSLCRDRKSQGRVRRLSGERRDQQALPLQDPPDGVQPPAGDGFHVQGPHAARRNRHLGRDRRGVRGVRPVSVGPWQLIIIGLVIIFWLLPAAIAFKRNHPHKVLILVLS